jgi:hypothetical protein
MEHIKRFGYGLITILVLYICFVILSTFPIIIGVGVVSLGIYGLGVIAKFAVDTAKTEELKEIR